MIFNRVEPVGEKPRDPWGLTRRQPRHPRHPRHGIHGIYGIGTQQYPGDQIDHLWHEAQITLAAGMGTEWNSGGLVKNLGWDEDGIKHIDEKP